ncbi:MAG: glycosyltransferase family 87 protein [Thermodesulfovibrionales bacterium]
MMFANPRSYLNKRQKTLLAGLLLALILFGAWVELRGAFLKRPMTDLGVYLRAGYAVRADIDIYSVTDDNGWHYVYPPFFAILMSPLAHPPKDYDSSGYLPYKFTVGFWYVFTMALGIYGIHILAKTLEETTGDVNLKNPTVFSQQWWALRLIPFLIMLPAIGRSQMRGQVGLIVAYLLCISASNILRKKRFMAGVWLSVASAIKVIPVFLFILPVWRRDRLMLLGGVVGFLITLVIIPLLILGIDDTITSYKTFYNEVLIAGFQGDQHSTRGAELTCITCTDSNSPMAVLHNILNPEKTTRPREALPIVRLLHWLFSFMLLALLLFYGDMKNNPSIYKNVQDKTHEIIFMGCLAMLMCIVSPVFHPHYISMIVPFIVVLIFILWEMYGYNNIPTYWTVILWSIPITHIVTSIGGPLWFLRDFGLVFFNTLILFLSFVILLRQQTTLKVAQMSK